MTIDDFTFALSRLFTQSASAGFSPETEFKKHPEWSSLLALVLIATIEDEFDVLLKGDEILNAKTVQDLFTIVASKKN